MEIDWNFQTALLKVTQKRFLFSAYIGQKIEPLGGGAMAGIKPRPRQGLWLAPSCVRRHRVRCSHSARIIAARTACPLRSASRHLAHRQCPASSARSSCCASRPDSMALSRFATACRAGRPCSWSAKSCSICAFVGLISLGWVWPQSRLLFGQGSGGRRLSTSDNARVS